MSRTLLGSDIAEGATLPPITVNITLHRLVLHAGGSRDMTSLHYDDAAAQAAGARGPFINNVFALGMWERLVREWAGSGAVIHCIHRLSMRSFNVVGDQLTTSGSVLRRWSAEGVDFAEIAVETFNSTSGRTTIGPGTVLISLPPDGDAQSEEDLNHRYEAAAHAGAGGSEASQPALEGTPWAEVGSMIDANLLTIPQLDGADRVERSVIRRLCEPLELFDPVHFDEEIAQWWGHRSAVGPVCGIGTTYPDPGAWSASTDTNYPIANRDADPAHPGGVENGEACARPPFPKNSIGILTEVSITMAAPIYLDDQISVRSVRITNVVPKTTLVGEGAFVTFVDEMWNDTGKVGEVTKVQFQYVPSP